MSVSCGCCQLYSRGFSNDSMCTLQLAHVNILHFALQDINYSGFGYFGGIHEIRLSSNLFSSHIRKLIHIGIKNILIKKEKERGDDNSPSHEMAVPLKNPLRKIFTKFVVKYVAIHIDNIVTELSFLNLPKFKVEDLFIDGRIMQNTLIANLNIYSARCIPNPLIEKYMVDILCRISVEIAVNVEQSPSLESLIVKIPVFTITHEYDLCVSSRFEEKSVLVLENLMLLGKVKGNNIDFNVLLETFKIDYNHENSFEWIEIASNLNKKGIEVKPNLTPLHSDCWFETLLKHYKFNINADLRKVLVLLRLSESEAHCASIGIEHLTVVINSLDLVQDYDSKLSFLTVLFGQCCWSAELLLKSFVCSLGTSFLSSDYSVEKFHSWGTPIFFGAISVNLSRCSKLQGTLDVDVTTLRFEWSPSLSQWILQGLKCFLDYRNVSPDETPIVESKSSSEMIKLWNIWKTTVTVRNINLFFITDDRACLMLRTDVALLESATNKLVITLEDCGAELLTNINERTRLECVNSLELKNFIWLITSVCVTCTRGTRNEVRIVRRNFRDVADRETYIHLLVLAEDIQFVQKAIASRDGSNHGSWRLSAHTRKQTMRALYVISTIPFVMMFRPLLSFPLRMAHSLSAKTEVQRAIETVLTYNNIYLSDG